MWDWLEQRDFWWYRLKLIWRAMTKFTIHIIHACNSAIYIFVYFYVYIIMWRYFSLAHYVGDSATTYIFGNVIIHMLRKFRRTFILLLVLMMIVTLDFIQYTTDDTYNSLIHYQLGRFFCELNKSMPSEVLASFTRLTPNLHSLIHYLIKDTFICHSDTFLYRWIIGIISLPIATSYALLYIYCYPVFIGLQAICSILVNIVK